MQQMPTGSNDSCEFCHPFVERYIFERAACHHEIERVVGEGKRQEISLGEGHVTRAPRAFDHRFSRGTDRGGRQIKSGDVDGKVERSQERER